MIAANVERELYGYRFGHMLMPVIVPGDPPGRCRKVADMSHPATRHHHGLPAVSVPLKQGGYVAMSL